MNSKKSREFFKTTILSSLKFILIILLLSCTLNLQGQTTSTTSKTEDNRYITQVDASTTDIRLADDSGLVQSMTLGIEWWTLLKEPIYKYLFRWKRGDRVFSEAHTRYITDQELDKYPDLQKRFRNLKPQYLGFNLGVKLHFEEEITPDNTPLPDCVGGWKEATYTNRKYFELNDFSGQVDVNSTVHFYIDAAGKTGNDLSPGSPKNWNSFIRSDCPLDNSIGYFIFKNSTKATFSLELVKIEIPKKAIDAIVTEFLKRESNAENDEEESEEPTQKDSGSKDKTNTDWEDLEGDDTTADTSWDKKNRTASSSEKDSWETGGKNDWDSKESSNDNKQDRFEISYQGSGWGVKDKVTGEVLIPYGPYQIVEYKPEAQIAKVRKEIGSTTESITPDCRKRIKFFITKYESGYIDKNGNWLVEPKKEISVSSDFEPIYITLTSSDCDYDCKKRASERRERNNRKCGALADEKIQEIYDRYKSMGYE